MATIEQVNGLIEKLGEFRWRGSLSGIECDHGSYRLLFLLAKGTDEAAFSDGLAKSLADGHGERIPDGLVRLEVIDGFVPLQGTIPTLPTAPLVAPGVQIGFQLKAPFPPTAAGTLGCFVVKDGYDECFLLSANHVLAMNGWARNDPTKPWPQDPTEIFTNPLSFCYPSKSIASLESVDYLRGSARYPYYNDHECALAELDQLPPDPSFPFPVVPKPRLPECGDAVKIFTRRYSHNPIRYGHVRAIVCNREMRFEFGRFRFHYQFLIGGEPYGNHPFAEKGDSGSLIFLHNPGQPDDGTPLGMLYAASAPNNLFLACPLVKFFDDHKLTVLTHWPPK